MTLFGFSLTRTKAAPPTLSSVDGRSGWWPVVRESFAGAWQRNIECDTTTILTFSALYACITLIAGDIAKLRIKLVEQDDGIWTEVQNPAYSPVLRKPNHFQTRIQFLMNWVASKLIHGNAYILKQRDQRGVVVALYVLDPTRVRPLVAADGAVYYEVKTDNLSGIADVTIPASEIIHDVMVPLYHPLVGVSPIRACGLAAMQGLRIQENSTLFFQHGSNPGGVLTAPGFIKDETAQRLKAYWEENFSGANVGRVAVLGDGLKYEAMTVNAVDAQLIEQLKWTAENVCTAFHVPPYMVGIGPPPPYTNVQALSIQYFNQALQIHIESIEVLLDEGMGMSREGAPQQFGTEFDVDNLMRMDTSSLVEAAGRSIQGGGMSPDEARFKFYGLGPVPGGGNPYLQQQQFSLEALAERDRDKPFAKPDPAAPATAATTANEKPEEPKSLRLLFEAVPPQRALPAGEDAVIEGELVPDDVEREAADMLRELMAGVAP